MALVDRQRRPPEFDLVGPEPGRQTGTLVDTPDDRRRAPSGQHRPDVVLQGSFVIREIEIQFAYPPPFILAVRCHYVIWNWGKRDSTDPLRPFAIGIGPSCARRLRARRRVLLQESDQSLERYWDDEVAGARSGMTRALGGVDAGKISSVEDALDPFCTNFA